MAEAHGPINNQRRVHLSVADLLHGDAERREKPITAAMIGDLGVAGTAEKVS